MKTIMGKLILLLAGCLLLLCILPIPAVAWPPPCPSPCEYWNGYECYCHEACCYDSDCDGFFECYSCNLDTCTCEDDQSKCSGCCKCDYGMCVDDDDECTGCEDCSGCSCVDNDENCTGCMECENAECIGNPTVKSVRIFWKTLFDEGWFDYDFDDVHYVTSLPCWCTHYTSESNKFGHAHTPSPGFPIEHEGDTYTATMSDNWWDDYYDSYTRVSSSSCYGNCFSYATGRSYWIDVSGGWSTFLDDDYTSASGTDSEFYTHANPGNHAVKITTYPSGYTHEEYWKNQTSGVYKRSYDDEVKDANTSGGFYYWQSD